MLIEKMSDTEEKTYYWRYQRRLGEEYLIPFVQQAGYSIPGARVLDIGSAEGGILSAFAAEGAQTIGIEISISRLKHAVQFARQNHLHCQFVAADLFFLPLQQTPFDMILMLDVLEHLPDKEKALANITRMMTSDTLLLLTFPPFYSPFGGHQQMLNSFWRFIPYFHTVPFPLWRLIAITINKWDANRCFLQEMENLRNHRLSINRMKKMAEQLGLQVIAEDYHFIRPTHKLRYGWPVISARRLQRIPLIREVLISGVTFLLKKK